jgi:SAM-dependent methyltransferase
MQSVERFSSRVANYVRYRPGYPKEVLELLKKECGLTSDSLIADIGSGTGKSAEIFLQNGNFVIGVEPNAGMRAAAESLFANYRNFKSGDGTAEATGLTSSTIDFVITGQAFHWFDPIKSRAEFKRILKAGGWVVLIWNERQVDTTPFLRAYEQLLLTLDTDYRVVRQENATAAIERFFSPKQPRLAVFPNAQEFDFESLKGRLLSSSYTPEPAHPGFGPMLTRLKEIFDEHEEAGVVRFEYDTRVFYEQLQNKDEG